MMHCFDRHRGIDATSPTAATELRKLNRDTGKMCISDGFSVTFGG